MLWDEAHTLDGRPLGQLLTTRLWADRLLGVNRSITARNLLTTVALGNQMRVLGDLRRRTVLIELESPLADPSLRSGFRHPDLKHFAEERRGSFLSALLTILRAWHLAGEPCSDSVLGSFEAWAGIVGGVLDLVGVPGFLDNIETTTSLDDDATEFGWHLAELWRVYGAGEFRVLDVLTGYGREAVETPSIIADDSRTAGRDLGNLYRRNAGRRYAVDGETLTIRRGEGRTHGGARWRVERGGHGAEGGGGGGHEGTERGGQGGVGGHEPNGQAGAAAKPQVGDAQKIPPTNDNNFSREGKNSPPSPPSPPHTDEPPTHHRPMTARDWATTPEEGTS